MIFSMDICKKCGSILTGDDVGLFKKFICRYADRDFYCKYCIAEELKCTVELLDRKIAEYKASGCALFK